MKSSFNWRSLRGLRPAVGVMAIGAILWLGSAIRSVRGDDLGSSDATHFYKVQILHPAKVGDRMHMKRDIERSMTEATEEDGKHGASQTASTQINFTGTLEVLRVDKHGQPVRWRVTGGVAGMNGTATSGHESLLKPGSEFTVSFSGGKAVIADTAAHPLSENAKKALAVVFESTGGKGDASLDDILDNSSASRSASWDVNKKALVAALQGFDSKLKQSDVSGTARIKSIGDEEGKQVLTIDYEFNAKCKTPNNPPAGTTPVSATLTETGTLSLPANGSTGYTSSKASIHTNGVFKWTANKRETTTNRFGLRTYSKSVPVHYQGTIDQNEQITTLMTYGIEERGKKVSPFDAAAKSSASSDSAGSKSPASEVPAATNPSASASSGQ